MKRVKTLIEAYVSLPSKEKVQFWHDLVCNMNVSELMGTATVLRDEFGIAFPAPVATQPLEKIEAIEEQTEFNVILKSFGAQKVQVIKVVRKLTGLGLRESKELVENAPIDVEKGVSKEAAQTIKAQLEEVGAVAEIT